MTFDELRAWVVEQTEDELEVRENDPVWGNRKGTSGIHVAIDDFDSSPHMSLQLCLDVCLQWRLTSCNVAHDGKITVGRSGAAGRDLLLDYVSERAPDLVRSSSVFLGSVSSGRALTFADVGDLVFNLLHYAEIRDRFREDYKARRK